MIAPALATLLLAAAPAGDAAALARKVQAFYERTGDLQARFVQTYTYSGFGGRKQASTGTLRVKKPGMMRWDYDTPEKKTIAVKGSRLVQWEPEANQVYVDERFDASAMSAAVTFLLGKGDLVREFEVDLSGAGWLVLTPRAPDPRVAAVELEVGPEGQVTATRVRDGSGNVNEIRFEDVRRNAGLSAADFDVALPKGVRRVTAPSP
ncbi:MAG TPA: outer membrane lipoprotein carrier protein LolA [Anaeromyxobacteraceae bacterium]|nr:outer membrane lipoprotein carrier protein LolA [Anaeromyxobacteraceae bacterium]